ncbi:esterase [Pleurocapsales cyanobacterium LEGE 06147]|nr:esterase [Pleurocapsales cyanobacterium LEGE 06147]
MPKLVCFGDSITAKEQEETGTPRLTPRLRQAFPTWTIINSGMPGDTTKTALDRLQRDVLIHCPDLVAVLLGTGDASEKRRVPILEYENNLTSIARQISPQKTVLINSPPIDDERLLARNRRRGSPFYNLVTLEDLEHYAQVSEKVAKTTGSHFINLWSIMCKESDYSRLLKEKDGVHFNEKGYEFLTNLLTAKIKSIWNSVSAL